MVGDATLNEFRVKSFIDTMSKFYTAAPTRLLRSELGACPPMAYYRPTVFGYERGAAEQIGVGLGVLFHTSCEWRSAEALDVVRVDDRAA